MSLQVKTIHLLAQRLLQKFDSKKMVEWAVEALTLGFDSESLVILAGLDIDSTEERENYFWCALKELKLNIKTEEHQFIKDYAKYIANATLNKHLSPKTGFEEMLNIYRSTNYSSRYIGFFEIEEDLSILSYDDGYGPIFNQGITNKNADQFIIKEFESFLLFEELEIDIEIRNKVFCKKCEKISDIEVKQKFQFKPPFKSKEWVCKNCKSNKFYSFRSSIGKEKILQKMKNEK